MYETAYGHAYPEILIAFCIWEKLCRFFPISVSFKLCRILSAFIISTRDLISVRFVLLYDAYDSVQCIISWIRQRVIILLRNFMRKRSLGTAEKTMYFGRHRETLKLNTKASFLPMDAPTFNRSATTTQTHHQAQQFNKFGMKMTQNAEKRNHFNRERVWAEAK